jgi:predicted transcriptional regulator
MSYVKNIFERKGGSVWTIGPDASVRDALIEMAEKGVGALVVVDGRQHCRHLLRTRLRQAGGQNW